MAVRFEDSLMNLNPSLSSEWHPEKNKPLTPYIIASRSGKKVWWKCTKGHEWIASVQCRFRGNGCPYCAGKLPSKDNNLKKRFPDIASEWHPSKNKKPPEQIMPGTSKRYWWICRNNSSHEWIASPNNRTTNGRGCPYCAHQKPDENTNLRAMNPKLAKEWHPTRNKLFPEEVFPNSRRVVWWMCPHGHEFRNSIINRYNNRGCPKCKSLAFLNPELIKEWDYNKNMPLDPAVISACSNKKVWWKCTKGHEWMASISHRSYGTGCPYCAHILPSAENNLKVVSPELVSEWNFSKNKINPEDVLPKSCKKYWWLCQNNHEWLASPNNRSKGKGCPICSQGQISRAGTVWLDNLGIGIREHPVHVRSKRTKVDGFDHESNTAYEFLGDYWHGNPAFYNPERKHPVTGKTFGNMLSDTIERLNMIILSGIRIIYRWEGFKNDSEYGVIHADRKEIFSKSIEIWKKSSNVDILGIL